MKVVDVRVHRFFGITRMEYRRFGKFTIFGFDSDAGKYFEARIDGHPELLPGRHIFCVSSSSRTFDVLAYKLPNQNNCIVEANLIDLCWDLAVAIVWIFVCYKISKIDFATSHSVAPLLTLAYTVIGAALIWLPCRTAKRLLAARRLRKHLGSSAIA